MNIFKTTPNSGINFIQNKEKGKDKADVFSILDIAVVISALFVIGFLIYLVINPGKREAELRNTERSANITAILSSLSAYISEEGSIPDNIPEGDMCMQVGHEICKSGPYDCTGLVNMYYLNEQKEEGEQMVSFPEDPLNDSENGTGYYIVHDGSGYITICAPYSERNANISFKKYMY